MRVHASRHVLGVLASKQFLGAYLVLAVEKAVLVLSNSTVGVDLAGLVLSNSTLGVDLTGLVRKRPCRVRRRLLVLAGRQNLGAYIKQAVVVLCIRKVGVDLAGLVLMRRCYVHRVVAINSEGLIVIFTFLVEREM